MTICPIRGYQVLQAAIDWLCLVFSFAPLALVPNADGSYGHVDLRLGAGVIMPATARASDPDIPWARPLSLQGRCVALDEVESHAERAMAEGAEIVPLLAATDYSSRESTVRALEGNLWTFGTYRPAL